MIKYFVTIFSILTIIFSSKLLATENTPWDYLKISQELFSHLLEGFKAKSHKSAEEKVFLAYINSTTELLKYRNAASTDRRNASKLIDSINEERSVLAHVSGELRKMRNENRFFSRFIPVLAFFSSLALSTYYSWYSNKQANQVKIMCRLKSIKDEAWYVLDEDDFLHEDQSVVLYPFSKKAQVDLGNVSHVLRDSCSHLEKRVLDAYGVSHEARNNLEASQGENHYDDFGLIEYDNESKLIEMSEEVIVSKGKVISYKVKENQVFSLVNLSK